MYIYNANVITMAEKNYENGFILIENDKIKAVGDMSQLKDFSPSDSDIDAKGRTAYPGFVDAHTHIGAWEDGLAFEGDDFSCYENGRLKEDRQEDNKKSRCSKICTRRKSQERI